MFTYKDTIKFTNHVYVYPILLTHCQARCRDGAKVNHTHSHKFAQLNQNALNNTIENMKQLRNCLENVRMGREGEREGEGGREGGRCMLNCNY